MEKKHVLIVGAGIAGLSAGCYAALNGYDTTIHEMHSIPGGLCTAWERKGYLFDISMHMLTGSYSGPFHQMWKELGIIDNFTFHTHTEVSRVETGGKVVEITTDRKQTETALLELAPEDAKQIRKFCDLIYGRSMMNAASLKPAELQRFGDRMRSFMTVLPSLGPMIRMGSKTVLDYAEEFTNPVLRQAIRFFDEKPGWPMKGFPAAYLNGFIEMAVRQSAVPLGGSRKAMYLMADLFKERGGKLNLKSRVKDRIIEDDRVTGIELEDGSRETADEVIWAADGHHLINGLLDGQHTTEKIDTMYRDWQPVRPIVHVMMGVDMDLSKEPHNVAFEPEEKITIAGREFGHLAVLHHCFDSSMAPEGKSAVEVWYDTDADYWEELYRDKKAYKAEKKRIADYTIRQLEKRWPGFESKVEVVDVPTPATYVRYTGNWKGSPDGWYVTPQNMMSQEPVRRLPGLEGLWMAGQWTAPFTGTVMASLSGRQVVELICHGDGKGFRGS